MTSSQMEHPQVVSRGEWFAARKELLVKEKELTRQRDEIDRQRRELPWVKVEKEYRFDGPNGQRSLADLFENRSQLIVSHFMLGPGWKEGCVGCSFRSDHVEGALTHLEHHDVSLVTISRAPLAEIEAFKKRMGWRFPWLSSFDSEFNYDFQVPFKKERVATGRVTCDYEVRDYVGEEASGLSVFYKSRAGEIFHTYSTYCRGDEVVDTTYMYLDLPPNGPHHNLGDWVRHHDRYGVGGFVDAGGRFVAGGTSKTECGCGHEG